MNTMLYVRGNRADYDGWAQLGATGWSCDEVLPFFIASEDNERGPDEFHGVGGPLAVSDSRSVHPLLKDWVTAAQEAGLPATPDFNGAQQEGVGIYQVTQRNGRRCSSARAFLEPALHRPNLCLLHSTLALRIVWDRARSRRPAGRPRRPDANDPRLRRARASAPAPTSRRICSCSPASARLRRSAGSASSRRLTCRGSVATSRTTLARCWPTPAGPIACSGGSTAAAEAELLPETDLWQYKHADRS